MDTSPAEHPEAAPPRTAPAQRGEVPGAPGAWGLGFKPCGLGSPSFPLSQQAPARGQTRQQGRAGVWRAAGGREATGLFTWRGRAGPPGSSGGQKRPRRLVESDRDVVASGQSCPVRSWPCRAPAPRAHDAEQGSQGGGHSAQSRPLALAKRPQLLAPGSRPSSGSDGVMRRGGIVGLAVSECQPTHRAPRPGHLPVAQRVSRLRCHGRAGPRPQRAGRAS